ncbi:MAG: metalloregulator ArsR/SmtB family transcription factor [Syntrophomonas sp.]
MRLEIDLYERKVELLKALAHPIRLCIVKNLIQGGGCNVSYMEECLEVSQSVVSQHLTKLKAAGIIKGQRQGNEIFYEVENEEVKAIITALFQ